ncbi:hypothetical protein AVEN_145431-1, partial [Araneus ventricosus]
MTYTLCNSTQIVYKKPTLVNANMKDPELFSSLCITLFEITLLETHFRYTLAP